MKETARSSRLATALTKVAGKAIRKEPPRQMRAGVQAGYADIWWLLDGTVRFIEVKQGHNTVKPHQELRAKEMMRLGFGDTLCVRFRLPFVFSSFIVSGEELDVYRFATYDDLARRIDRCFRPAGK